MKKSLILLFTEANPDKGTETFACSNKYISKGWFTEANPDKGTETEIVSPCHCAEQIVYKS